MAYENNVGGVLQAAQDAIAAGVPADLVWAQINAFNSMSEADRASTGNVNVAAIIEAIEEYEPPPPPPPPKPPVVPPKPPVVPTNIFPTAIPVSASVGSAQITTPLLSNPATTPVATGFPLFQETFNMLLDAETSRRQAVDQQINLARLFADLQRASPTQAADLAVSLGLPSLEPDFSWTSKFVSPNTTGTFGGKVGSQNVRVPFAFSGRELSFLGQNPNVASIVNDIAARFGRPDVLQTSLAALAPTNPALVAMGGR